MSFMLYEINYWMGILPETDDRTSRTDRQTRSSGGGAKAASAEPDPKPGDEEKADEDGSARRKGLRDVWEKAFETNPTHALQLLRVTTETHRDLSRQLSGERGTRGLTKSKKAKDQDLLHATLEDRIAEGSVVRDEFARRR
jgi:hypothetical protein